MLDVRRKELSSTVHGSGVCGRAQGELRCLSSVGISKNKCCAVVLTHELRSRYLNAQLAELV